MGLQSIPKQNHQGLASILAPLFAGFLVPPRKAHFSNGSIRGSDRIFVYTPSLSPRID